MTSLETPAPDVFRALPFMGVIRVNDEAMRKHGYRMGDTAWSNLGQGQPEVGELPGAPPRYSTLDIDPADHAYGPVEGIDELREAVADHYNRLYRQGLASQYTAENVAISSGGRLALSRCGAAVANIRLGYFTPDYTAYEDLMTTFSRFNPFCIELIESQKFRIDPDSLKSIATREHLGALLISNPCNPTGAIITGDELEAWLTMARRQNITLLLDEFYSHYVYGEKQTSVSAAVHVGDVNEDRVILFDGLTKCFRYPGWRIGWMVAPRDVIRTMTAAGSFLDGGPSRPIQRAAVTVLEPKRADQETSAVRTAFRIKQKITIDALEKLGVTFANRGSDAGTFYAWGNVSKLPKPLNTGEGFMRAAFGHRVLTVPGSFFDVNPNRSRAGRSPYEQFVRFSFGPPRDNLEAGLGRLAEMIRAAS
ncbi:MAG: pyridoxal phosphate-dependent aminotransferase [Phycisphaerales bacterium]